MKYLCLAYGDPKRMEGEFDALVDACHVHDEELRRSGHLILMEALEWAAVTVRSWMGKVVTTDGPFVKTKEQVGGVFIIEARDLNEAVRVASMHPGARLGEDVGWGVEVRPIGESCHQ